MLSRNSNSADPAAATPEKRARSQDFARRYPARILVVEDQPLNQKIVCMLLERLGYEDIAIACDGREAVDSVASGEFDVIFMDILMPVMDGIEATRVIRNDDDLPRQPAIVATSGHALPSVKEDCRAAGMNAFLAKPMSIEDFRRAIPPCLEVGAALKPMLL